MAEHQPTDESAPGRPMDLERKVDVIAGAVADLQGMVADMATELSRLGPRVNELLDRHPAGLGAATQVTATVAGDVATAALEPVHASLAALTASAASQREELLLALEVLTRVAEAVERLDDRTEDRLAAVRDAAMTPAADLQAMLAARSGRIDARLDELAAVIEGITARGGDDEPSRLVERVDELARAVESLSWQLPDLVQEVAALRAEPPGTDLVGPLDSAADDLAVRLADHTDLALAGVLRLLDQRLDVLREALTESAAPTPPNVGGFEAGAVMGAAQAAWNRLEHRLDQEFDDLSRQLQTMGSLIERATATAEAAANRPVVTGEQLRSAAAAVKESVLRSRRDRRGRVDRPGLDPPRT